MKRSMAVALLLLASLAGAQTQSSNPQDVNASSVRVLLQNPPNKVPSASVSQVGGAPGARTLYYWIVSNYAIGNSSAAGPFVGVQSPNALSSSTYNRISWTPATGAASYDVLRTASPTPPAGACNCAVATAVTATFTNDQSESLNSYTVASLDPNQYTHTLTNEPQSAAASDLILRQNGLYVSDLTKPLTILDGRKYATATGNFGTAWAACLTALQATGGPGVCDMRGFSGAQASGTEVYNGITVATTTLLGNTTITCSQVGVTDHCINIPANNTRIIGSGRGVTIVKLANGAADFTRVFTTSQGGVVGPEIADLEIDGNRANVTGASVQNHAIMLKETLHANVHDVYIHSTNGDGIAIWGSQNNPAQYTVLRNIRTFDILRSDISTFNSQHLTVDVWNFDKNGINFVAYDQEPPDETQAVADTTISHVNGVGGPTVGTGDINLTGPAFTTTLWSAATTYNLGDFVAYRNIEWRSLAGSNTGNPPGADATHWTPLNARTTLDDITLSQAGINVARTPYVHITNANIFNPPGYGIKLQASNAVINKWSVTYATNSGTTDQNCIWLDGSTNNVPAIGTGGHVVSQGTCIGATGNGIYVINSSDNVIVDNTIDQVRLNGSATAAGVGFTGTNTKYSRNVVARNRISDSQSSPTMKYGVASDNDAVQAPGNTVTNAATASYNGNVFGGYVIDNNVGAYGTYNAAGAFKKLLWSTNSDQTVIDDEGANGIYLRQNGSFVAKIIGGAYLAPNSDGLLSLGASGLGWGQLFLKRCASAGGTCGAAASGSVSIAAAATTVTVATTAVTANSQILVSEDATLGTLLSVTCNTTTGRTYTVTTRTAGTSFVITSSAAPVTNPACLSYTIVN